MATLIINTDIDCHIYLDTEHYGIAKANEDFIIKISKGVYWVECRTVVDANISQDFDHKVIDDSTKSVVNISLLYAYRLKKLQSKYDYVGEFEYGFAKVSHKGELIGYIDTTCQLQYDDVVVLCDNVLCVKKGGLCGVLNSYEQVVPIKYKSIKLLGDKMLRLELNNRFCLVNLEGVKLTSLKYLAIEYAMNDTYALCFDRWQFVDNNINEIAPPNNVIVYTTNNSKLIRLNATYEDKFGQKLLSHLRFKDSGLLIFENAVTTIGESAFICCESLISITIPNSVTTIGEDAFAGCTSLTSITMPDSVTTIGERAFDGCKNLASVTIPESVTTIGVHAFSYCESLITITIPNSVTTIGDSAFNGCKNLTSVTIPESVTTIGEGIFSWCESLKEFRGKFTADSGRCLIVDNTIIAYANASGTTYTIPNYITKIGMSAFCGCTGLTNISMPDSVTTIGKGAFDSCTSLTSITIPESVTTIKRSTFSGCKNLTSVTIPDSVTTIGERAFSHCESLISITIPNSVTIIGDGAFSWCKNLTSVTIPDSVTTIGDSAFSLCESLISITMPDSVTTIGESAFNGCKKLTSVTIPESVTTIGEGIFSWCESLKEFRGKFTADSGRCLIIDNTIIAYANASGTTYTIPNYITKIGMSAFCGCTGLTNISMPDSVTTIGKGAFACCTSLTNITIPDRVTEIERSTFRGCRSLTSITIPDSVTTIRFMAFAYCDRLSNVAFGNSLTTINAYTGDHNITEIILPENIIKIDRDAFRHSSGIKEFVIPAQIEKLCLCVINNIKTVYCKAVLPPTATVPKCTNCPQIEKKSGVIFIPYQSYDKYIIDPMWCHVKERLYPYDFENNTPIKIE